MITHARIHIKESLIEMQILPHYVSGLFHQIDRCVYLRLDFWHHKKRLNLIPDNGTSLRHLYRRNANVIFVEAVIYHIVEGSALAFLIQVGLLQNW